MPVAGLRKHTTNRRSVRGARGLDISAEDAVTMVRRVRAGFPYKSLSKLQKDTQLPWAAISRFVAIPPRTLARRQTQGRLRPDESGRVLRARVIFDLALQLFEGDADAARKWLQTPQIALCGETPLDFSSTDLGAREVEKIIGRLEHGVFL